MRKIVGLALAVALLAPLSALAQPPAPAKSQVVVADYKRPEVTKTAVTANGLVADLYVPADGKARHAAIIVLGGSEGGMGAGAARDAKLIAEHGYVTLQLAYFDAPGLPKDLGLIPLEYFKTAIDWLRAQPNVDPERIGIEGTSIGGEAVLVIASHDPRIKAVVAAVPSSVVWPGISHTNPNPPSTWTLAGQPLPDLPYGGNGTFTSIYALYADGLKDLDKHPDAVIQVERINGSVMLICGKNDTLWPSCPMSEQVVARLKAKGFKHPLMFLAYSDAGHAVFGPPVPADNPHFSNLGSLGGSAKGNEAAREDNWFKAMDFMDEALKP
jgi:dienelactone hydrolase